MAGCPLGCRWDEGGLSFLVTFVAVIVAGAWMLIRGLVVRLRSLAATYRR